jgi:YD repeat protein
VDKDGKFVGLPFIIGAAVGIYSGGVIANRGELNPVKWDYSGRTIPYMIMGGIVGGLSASLGATIAGTSIPMSNTLGITAGSLANSLGTYIYTGGQTPISISFGVVSYDFTNGEFGYLGKRGNKWYQNLGYGLGALANVSDLLAGLTPGEVQLQTEYATNESSDFIGHSQILDVNGNSLIDFGPIRGGVGTKFLTGRNDWISFATGGSIKQTKDVLGNAFTQGLRIKGVNVATLSRISNKLNVSPGFYNFFLRSCSSVAARSLTLSGAPMLGLHPYLLMAQAYLWSQGLRPWSLSHLMVAPYEH